MIVTERFEGHEHPGQAIVQRALAVALKALVNRGRDPALFQARTYRVDGEFIVEFIDRDVDPRRFTRGSLGKITA